MKDHKDMWGFTYEIENGKKIPVGLKKTYYHKRGFYLEPIPVEVYLSDKGITDTKDICDALDKAFMENKRKGLMAFWGRYVANLTRVL